MIAAVYIAVQLGAPQFLGGAFGGGAAGAAAASAVITVGASILANALVPVRVGNSAFTEGQGIQGSTAYSANLSANQARLEQPIPVLYGRNKTFPDFAAQPYVDYEDGDKQYYNALLCLAQGEYRVESVLIDDTDITNFQDITVLKVLAPGELPTTVYGNVVNAPEVTGNEVKGTGYIGPFIGCRPRLKASKLAIDISFSRGLATYDNAGTPGNKSVTWVVEYRAMDDFGAPSTVDAPSGWTELATETLTAAQTSPIRKSYYYDLASPCRAQVRLRRVTNFDESNRVANTMEWIGLRSFLTDQATLCPTATHIEVRMRASEQLSGLTQRKIAVISRRKLRKWAPVTGWTTLQETRNPAWALADKWTNTTYGDGYADSRCDLQTLYNLSLTWDARQDRFDAVFDQTYDSYAADQMVAQAGRAAVFRRNSVMTVTRDQLRDLPVTAFTARNIAPNSVNFDYILANESTPDGAIVEYWDNRSWDWAEILCPAPGVVTPVRPQRVKLFGITGATHALREGTYQMANSFYRRKFASFGTELEGMIPAFGSAAVFAPSLPGWGASGDLVSVDSTTLVATLSEPVTWTSAQDHYISIITRDGSLANPIKVTRGASDFQVILSTYPTGNISTNPAAEERTKYVFGAATPYPSVIRVLGIQSKAEDSGARTFTISGVIEDDRVHLADAAYLPTDGIVQDSVNDLPVGGLPAVQLPAFYILEPTKYFTYMTQLIFSNQGAATVRTRDTSGNETGLASIEGWWWNNAPPGPFAPGYLDTYQIRVTIVSGSLAASSSAVDIWLGLGAERQWKLPATGLGSVVETYVNIEIRDTATQVVLAFADNFPLSYRT
jgi:hypothetical protein